MGNGLFDLFDKVLVLCDGREIYYGPVTLAKLYFEEMGFTCAPGANVADFLTSVAVPTERIVQQGFLGRVPNTAEEFELLYKQSPLYSQMFKEISLTKDEDLAREQTELLTAISLEKNRTFHGLSRDSSVYTVSFWKQVVACTKRYVPTSTSLKTN